MTFNVTVPNATQSPGLFPAQNNTNFDRLKAIINQEHNFLDTVPVPPQSQGIHRQCTFINKNAVVSSLPAGNGILYSLNDSFGQPQLNWYNGTNNIQVTPGVLTITGSATVANNAFQVIFPNPGYSYNAYVWVCFGESIPTASRQVMNISHFTTNNSVISYLVTNSSFITMSFNVADLRFRNTSGNSETFNWALQVVRLS